MLPRFPFNIMVPANIFALIHHIPAWHPLFGLVAAYPLEHQWSIEYLNAYIHDVERLSRYRNAINIICQELYATMRTFNGRVREINGVLCIGDGRKEEDFFQRIQQLQTRVRDLQTRSEYSIREEKRPA